MDNQTPRQRISATDGLLAAAALALLLILLLAPPHDLLEKANRAGTRCVVDPGPHILGGRPAAAALRIRCSGTYLGTLAGLIALTLASARPRHGFPHGRYVALFGVFLSAWAVDGANSFLGLFPDAPRLYAPHNLLRLVTGTLEGLVIAAFLLPVFNQTLWAAATEPSTHRPAVAGWRDLAWLLVRRGGRDRPGEQRTRLPAFPLALLSGATVIMLFGMVNTMLILLTGAPARVAAAAGARWRGRCCWGLGQGCWRLRPLGWSGMCCGRGWGCCPETFMRFVRLVVEFTPASSVACPSNLCGLASLHCAGVV